MILQALTAYYEDLARSGKIARQGWGKSRISYALELGEGGEVRRVIPLETADEKGNGAARTGEADRGCGLQLPLGQRVLSSGPR